MHHISSVPTSEQCARFRLSLRARIQAIILGTRVRSNRASVLQRIILSKFIPINYIPWPILYTLYNLSWQRHSHWDQKTQGLVSAHLLDCPSNGPITLPYMVLTILSNDYTIVLQQLVASTYSSSLYPMWPPCIPPFWHCRRGCGRA